MTFRVVIEQEAEREFIEAVNFYDGRKPGLGQRFAHEVRATFRKVCENPERFRFASRLTRVVKMPRPWPYSIYFAVRNETAEIPSLFCVISNPSMMFSAIFNHNRPRARTVLVGAEPTDMITDLRSCLRRIECA